MAKGRTRQLSIAPGMSGDMLRLISEQRGINKEFDRRKPLTSPSIFTVGNQPPASDNGGRIIFVRLANGSLQAQYSDGSAWQTFLATSVSYATPTITYGTTYSAGTLNTTIRSDARLKYPIALMSAANSSTLTLTDDATDQTLTSSLGVLNIVVPAGALPGIVLNGQLGVNGTPLNTTDLIVQVADSTTFPGLANGAGFHMTLTRNDATAYPSGYRMEGLRFICTDANGPTYLAAETVGVEARFLSASVTGTNSWANRAAFEARMGAPTGAGNTFTNQYGLNVLGWQFMGTAGSYVNSYGVNVQMPTNGTTIRRAYSVNTTTLNLGTASANTEGYYCEDITIGTARRASFYSEGATTGTPTDVYAFYQGTAHVVGTNRRGFRAAGATTGTPTVCVGFEADAHSVGTDQWSFRGAQKYENTGTDFIASASSKGIIVKCSDDTTRYVRIRALYNGGAPSVTLDDAGTTLPTT